MHSFDRTLLAKLGFQDPDRTGVNSTRHDEIAVALLDLEVATRILKLVCKDKDSVKAVAVKLEVPISKGDGQYKTTIGFMDAAIWGTSPWSYEYCGKIIASQNKYEVHVEIKTQSIPIGEILRQINLYREHSHNDRPWVLVCDFDIEEKTHAVLKSQGIYAVEFSRLSLPM